MIAAEDDSDGNDLNDGNDGGDDKDLFFHCFMQQSKSGIKIVLLFNHHRVYFLFFC